MSTGGPAHRWRYFAALILTAIAIWAVVSKAAVPTIAASPVNVENGGARTIVQNRMMAKAGESRLPELSGGLKGYISMTVPRPPDAYRYGVSFYATVWPLLDRPLAGFQIGLPSTWIIPDNVEYKECLCPPGTVAKDNWPERGPTYRDVFQTIEGGLGYWVSTQFDSTTPKYRINGTPNCYSREISSPGWGFGQTNPLPDNEMGLAVISNRLLIPPDGFTFDTHSSGHLLGNAWMALPLMPPSNPAAAAKIDQPTGEQSWTLFLAASNFKGPVAFWIPETWSRIARGYPPAAGRGLDARPALMSGGAMEINTVPYFTGRDAAGVEYSRIPRLHFPVDDHGRTVLMQDVAMYSHSALFDAVKRWGEGGPAPAGGFGAQGVWFANCYSNPIHLRQGPEDLPLSGVDSVVKTSMFGKPGSLAFGLEWSDGAAAGIFPEYYRQEGDRMTAVSAADVPAETHLSAETFTPATTGKTYASPAGGETSWNHPGPVRGPFSITASDGSRITYSWYRFVDQPAFQHLGLSQPAKERLQRLAEQIHARWPVTRDYIPRPSSGQLATLDPVLIVRPPRGLERGYVPIVTRQEIVR